MCNTKIFRGYIRCKDGGKGSLDRYKNVPDRQLRTWDEIQDFPDAGGVLAPGIVLVDIDDRDQSEILLKIVTELNVQCQVRRSSRGMHFFFKNNGVKKCHTKINTPISLNLDMKIGDTNAYAVIRKNGKNREIIRDCETLEPIPYWLQPLKTSFDFLHLKDGDGRNDMFYRYILVLQRILSKDEIINTLRIINKYIVDDSLSEQEFKSVTREDAFKQISFISEDGKVYIHEFCEYLKLTYNIKKDGVGDGANLMIYQDGIYVRSDLAIEQVIALEVPGIRSSQRAEILKYLLLKVDVIDSYKNFNLICFKNGVYDMDKDELLSYDPDFDLISKIPHNYNPYAKDDSVENVLNKISCFDAEIRSNLEETIGYCFYKQSELAKSVILLGEKGSNGKSVYLSMLKWVLGEQNWTSLDLNEIGQKFAIAMLYGKMANIADDIGSDFLKGQETANFRKIVAGNELKAEEKGRKPFVFKPFCKLVMSCNEIPKMGRCALDANMRRMVIIPFNAKFSKQDPDFDPYISTKLRTESAAEYLVQLGLQGLKRILATNDFTPSQAVEKELKQFERDNNPCVEYLENNPLKDGKQTSAYYLAYCVFCEECNIKALSQKKFNKEVVKIYPNFEKKYKKLDTGTKMAWCIKEK